jgi:hypothetical protein
MGGFGSRCEKQGRGGETAISRFNKTTLVDGGEGLSESWYLPWAAMVAVNYLGGSVGLKSRRQRTG